MGFEQWYVYQSFILCTFMTNQIYLMLMDKLEIKPGKIHLTKRVLFTHNFLGRVLGFEIDHLGRVFWF